ncbi:DmsC/YnfH family molybdoenzyme membrane anchor subunit [Nibricoccus aquaticus]|uniref:DmsC/YnfH family molybdoenzyme membrane anchor subunit n=1 Tax=Nibricoccus aquaticus TaxID=2576891 RepID=UPI001C30F2D5|nr:DmsC/YnfH family molybdoenzyme membrane anchor subunit [Nibricoccus aquaticus]
MPAPKQDPVRTLIDELLAEQQRLQTPVARFSEAHDRGASPALEPLYRDLIPLSKPGPGEQYAFEVDLDSCTGCKACVAGCHSLNGLDDEETWRDVGMLVGGTRNHPFQQTVTSACHHCADPGCLNGCPVLAYEKDPVTGIVRHLDDQCIGCQYCILKCPYDVPKYNDRLGIVRKCDMCHSRLAVGEAPACVQACPTQAIKIVTVTTHLNGQPALDTTAFLPGAPAPEYTQPTTRYTSSKPLPAEIIAADAATLRPQHPHWPLVFMLTLMPMAVGCFTVAACADLLAPRYPLLANLPASAPTTLALTGWLAGAAGLFASVFHLGQPLRAWRVFLGLRKSWLSREAVIFGPWFGLATATAAVPLASQLGLFSGSADVPVGSVSSALASAYSLLAAHYSLLTLATASVGLLGLFCSSMIYIDTQRHLWRAAQTIPRFFGSGAVLGFAILFAAAPTLPYFFALLGSVLFKLAIEARELRPLDSDDDTPTASFKTAQMLTGPLRLPHNLRVTSALLACILAFALTRISAPSLLAWTIPALLLASELTERYLYFRAVVAPKMPGVVSK